MIRQALHSDLGEVFELYKAGLQELGIKYREDLVLRKIHAAFECAPCFLLEVDDNIIGMADLHLGEDTFTGVLTLTDLLFYVEPKHRNLKRLSGLVEACKSFADKYNLPLQLNFISKDDEKLRKRLLEMHGFKVQSLTGVYTPWAEKAAAASTQAD